jgi:hypothetical protein
VQRIGFLSPIVLRFVHRISRHLSHTHPLGVLCGLQEKNATGYSSIQIIGIYRIPRSYCSSLQISNPSFW